MARSATGFPVRKVTTGALAGAVTILFAALLPEQIGGKPVPPEVATALTTILMTLVAYITPPAAGEVIETAVKAEPEPRPTPEPIGVASEVQFLQARVEWAESFLQELAQRLILSVPAEAHRLLPAEIRNGRRQRSEAYLKRVI